MTEPTTPPQADTDQTAARIEHWIREHPSRAYAARFPVDDVQAVLAENTRLRRAFTALGEQTGGFLEAAVAERERYVAENQRLRAELADAAGYLAVTHRHANRHDVLGANLACAGCALLDRIEGAQDEIGAAS